MRLPLLLLLQIWMVIATWQPRFHLGRPMFGFLKGAEHLQMLLLEKETGQSLVNRNTENSTHYGPAQASFTQRLDHFDKKLNKTWGQRYFYNLQYRAPGSNVVFLMIGGESPESINWVKNENYPFVTWGKKFGAALFALEHRFYGESRPTPNQSVENLKYLSSRQALEDVANFIRSMNVKYSFKDPMWVTFGGSYSGDLSLWARQIYPDLIVGAVGSSAPVDAVVDFWGYLEVVENALRSHSDKCAENVRKGFETMTDLMETEAGRAKLSKVFKLDPPLSKTNLTYNDIQNFYSVIFGNFQGAVQYSGDNAGKYRDGYGVPDVCKRMIDVGEPLDNIQKVNEYMSGMYGKYEKTSHSYDEMIEYLKNEQFGDTLDFDSSARSWTWQTCTEFGYYQTTDGGPVGIFGSGTPLTLYLNMCSDVFGKAFNSAAISKAVHSTQMHYGGSDRYKGTNVVITNGNIDPWHALGKYTSSDQSVVWYLINGTAHCADMYPPSEKDKPGLTLARRITERNIEMWLSGASNANVEAKIERKWKRPEERGPLTAEEIEAAPKAPIELSKMKFPKWEHNKKMFLGRPPHGFLPPPDEIVGDVPIGFEEGFFLQPVDHFDNQNPNTFLQKYRKNSQWARPGGPNFLKIGGEGPENPRWVLNENMTYLTWAKKYGAMVYSLEHRYYGDSIVGGNATHPNPDLTYLSSIQMLYDLASYIRSVKRTTNNTAPWIVFGGSYPGNLALWMRQLFPDLVLGAVGSSAPVEAKLDFYEYLEVVETAIKTYNLSCAKKIQEGFAKMHQLALTGEGRAELTKIFTLEPKWTSSTNVTEIDLQFFFSNIYGQFQGAVQYSGDNTGAYASGYGIPEMCSIINSNRSAIDSIAEFNKYMTEFYTGAKFKYTENSYSDFITYLKTAHQYGPKAAASWLWTWQTCTEFGYFQSSDSGYSIFGSPTPVNLFTRMCIDLYGKQYTAVAVQKSIDKINKFYGGIDFFNGTNVVIPNGSIDPWHALGLYTSSDPSVVYRLINGTAHCADMYPAREQDLPDLVATRKLIEENIAKWLKSSETSTTPKSTTHSSTASTTKSPPTSKQPSQPTPEPTKHTTGKPPEPMSTSPVEVQTTSTIQTTTKKSSLSVSFIGFTFALHFLTALMLSSW